MVDNAKTMYRLLEVAEETTEASIDSCSAIMPFDVADKLPETQTNIDDNIIEANEKIANIVQDLHKLQELKQILQDKEQNLQGNVKDYMGLHTTLTLHNKPIIAWKNCTRCSLDLPQRSKPNIRSFTGCFSKKRIIEFLG